MADCVGDIVGETKLILSFFFSLEQPYQLEFPAGSDGGEELF